MSVMLQRGDLVPHFQVRHLDGELIRYEEIWQRRHLVVVAAPNGTSEAIEEYVRHLTGRMADFVRHETACVVTRDPVAGVPAPAVLIADRWGEVVFVKGGGADASGLPDADEILDWLAYLQSQCPECEGEAR